MMHSTAYAQTKTIRITNGEWVPYMSEQLPQYGLISRIVTEAFKLEDIDVEWGFFPWQRAYYNAQNSGDWDASCCWWPTSEIKSDGFLISNPVGSNTTVFFYLNGLDFDWSTLEDLANYRVGTALGYKYGDELDRMIEEGKITTDVAKTDKGNFRKLLEGRIDVYPTDLAVGVACIEECFSAEEARRFRYHSKSLDTTTLNLIISQKSENAEWFMEKFNSGLNKLKDSGRFDEMTNELMKGKYDVQSDR